MNMANTINDKLTYLAGTKDAIKQAIINKGVSVSDSDTFRSYADKIATIQGGGGGETAKIDATNLKFGGSTFSEFDPTPFDFSNVTNCTRMFDNCKEMVTVGLFDTSKVTSMSFMFQTCEALENVPQFDTSSVTFMTYMFFGCKALKTVPQFDTSNVTNVNAMFMNCTSLISVPLMDFHNVTITGGIFNECTNLTTLGGFTGLQVNLILNQNTKLTAESIMNVINQAADMSAQPRTLTLSSTVFKKLTEDQIATANAKGWNIAS